MSRFITGKKGRAAEVVGEDAPSSSRSSFNTVRHNSRSSSLYRTRVTLSMIATSVMTVIVLILVLAVVWEGEFHEYTYQNMQRLAESTASKLAQEYEENDCRWTSEVLSYANSVSSTSSEIGVQVFDARNQVLYDDTWPSKSENTNGAEQISLAPTDSDLTVSAEIVSSVGEHLGSVRMWAFGSNALITKADAAFRDNSYSAILIAACIAVAIAGMIGYFFARSLLAPIKRITSTAAQIRGGDLSARCGLSGSDEIGQLGEVFDDMASNLERDIQLEHRLTSDVAHELRTPLMAIQATVEAMQDGILPVDTEHLQTVDEEVGRLSRLVNAMLRLSRIENGSNPLTIERTDLVWLIRSLATSQECLFADNGLRLRFSDNTVDGVLVADVDADLIREAAVNLLSNAMRYTSKGGYVVVSVSQDHGDAVISVEDTGIGIAKDDVKRIFSRFWRSDASRERASGGLGVGLALTKEIVDRHNGYISVESELNRGTTIAIHIPLRHENRTKSFKPGL